MSSYPEEFADTLLKVNFFTASKRSLGQGNIFTSVCQEFCSVGGGVPGPWGGLLPVGGYLVETPPPTVTAAGGTHPTGMHSCLTQFVSLFSESESQRPPKSEH